MYRIPYNGAYILFLLCSLVAQLHGAERASLDVITHFPHQDTTKSNSEALPLTLSDGSLMLVWAESTAIRYSKSTDGGVTWNAPVHFVTPAGYAKFLTGLRTLSGRLMVFWYDTLYARYTYSDDNGLTWSPTAGVQIGQMFLHLSQTSDGKLWLASRPIIGPGSPSGGFRTSTDDGSTWSAGRTLPTSLSGPKADICFVSGPGGTVHCIYSAGAPQANIERITSTDGGATWSSPFSVVSTSSAERRPRIARQSNGEIWLLYDFTRVDSMPNSYQRSDINYVISTDSGITWSSPVGFTRFVGNDYMHNVTMFNDKPFVSFASERWRASYSSVYASTQLWYGVIGETPDNNPPPIFLGGGPYHYYSGLENWIQAYVDDESGITSVIAHYSLGGVIQPPVRLWDDGVHFDELPGDNIFGVAIPPLPNGTVIESWFDISDDGGNSLNNVFGDAYVSSPPPAATHVTQGSSMRVAFDRFATLGKYVLPNYYPSFGLSYPSNATLEHLFGAGIWVGGKVDTTASGTGERIRAVSTGYEGWSGPYYEFYPAFSTADTIWRVYGRNAVKPPGWDQYWGNALSFRSYGDESFYNQYNDYTVFVPYHVPMGINVIQSSFTWNDPTGDGIQILEFKIMNNFVRSIDSAYVGFFVDGDVGPVHIGGYYNYNCSGYYSPLRMGYIQNLVHLGSTPVGVSVLKGHRSLDSLRFSFQWYPGTQSPATDVSRYALMSSGIIMSDQCPSFSETRFLFSFGPFTIRPYTSLNPDTLRVAFALLSGMNLNELQLHASRARDLYQIISDVKEESSLIPAEFRLEQNYPNPFNPVTNFQFSIANSQVTILKVYDVLGREVATLVNDVKQPGVYAVQWDASGVASGVYFYRLQAGNFVASKKLLLLR